METRWAHGPWINHTQSNWIPIPDMSASVVTPANGEITATFSAEAHTSSSMGRMWVRAIIDGQPATPGDVVFAQGGELGKPFGTHSFTFVGKNLSAGLHTVQMEWLGDAGFTALMRDRSLVVMGTSGQAPLGVRSVTSVESGWISESTATWVPMPGMNASISTPANSDIAITLTAEASATLQGRNFVRVLVDGQVISPSDVMLANYNSNGTMLFTFTKQNVSAGVHNLHVQWRVDVAGQHASVADRTLVVYGSPVVLTPISAP